MKSKLYCIEEELFCEDSNSSEYQILDDFVFTSRNEAEKYVEKHFTENEYQSMRTVISSKKDTYFIITDDSFPEKYTSSLGNSYEKFFFVKELVMHK